MNGLREYDVYLHDRYIDRVVFALPHPARDVRRMLIEMDGHSKSISVYRKALGRHAYDDMARATKPEEC